MRTIRASASGVVSSASAPPGRKSLLLDSVSEALVLRHYSAKTRPAYVGWVRRFVIFHQRRHPVVPRRADFNPRSADRVRRPSAARAAARPEVPRGIVERRLGPSHSWRTGGCGASGGGPLTGSGCA